MTTSDRRRWITALIVVMAAMINVLDNTVLNVAIPTIQRELQTDLPTLQWVLTGYSLTFATLLIIGGRLGDIYGPRRTFIVGAALFGLGSFVASEATSVGMLLVGEAVIEGIGASLMLPATLAILSTTFHGPDRAKAFAVWGAVTGATLAFGPLVGGFLTTNYSWRWAFRINVIVAPIAVIGALLFVPRTATTGRRPRIDFPGAILVASGMFLLVFALSEGGLYGWFRPLQTLTVAGWTVWPATLPISVIPVLVLAAGAILGSFFWLEWAKSRASRDPLFDVLLLRTRSFRYCLVTLLAVCMGQMGFVFVLSVMLQDGHHLSATETGLWIVPSGVGILVGSQIGARLTRWINTTDVVRTGVLLEVVGLVAIVVAISPDVTFLALAPGVLVFGIGLGFSGSQLNNVMLTEVPREHAGSASGVNNTVRQLGGALGVAVSGSLIAAQTLRHAAAAITSSGLAADVKAQALEQLHVEGVGALPAPGTSVADGAALRRLAVDAVDAGVRPALIFAAVVVAIGAAISFLIPRVGVPAGPAVEPVEGFEPADLDAALLD